MLRITKVRWNAFRSFACVLLIAVTGCSGGEEPKNQQTNQAQKSASTPTVQAPRVRSSDRKTLKRKPAKTEQTEMVGNPEDQFEIMDYVHNFRLQKPEAIGTKNQFSVILPTKAELDSTSFVIVNRVTEKEEAAPDSSFKLPDGFSAVKESGYSARGLPNRIRCAQDYSEMVLVPAGISIQGVNESDKNTAPQFTVYQNAFYIDVHEVTLEQYRRWRSEMIAKKGKIPAEAGNNSQPAEFPALGILYTDALNYARTMGKELPLETQWEKAARGETGFLYPWGNGRPLWSKTRNPGQIDSVRSFSGDLSPYGVFDLAGNAREWCRDWFSENAYQSASAFADAGVVRNWTGPKRPVVPGTRVVRGNQQDWKVYKRAGENMRTPPADLGFRCVLNLPGIAEETQATESANAF